MNQFCVRMGVECQIRDLSRSPGFFFNLHPTSLYSTILYTSRYSEEAGIPTLAGRRDLLSKNLFNDIVITKDHKLVNLLPKRSTNSHQLRNRRVFDTSL